MIPAFQPKLVSLLKTYSRKDFGHDLVAGITVALELSRASAMTCPCSMARSLAPL